MGDRYLRKLLVGGCAALVHRKGHNDALRLWADQLMARKRAKYKFQADRGRVSPTRSRASSSR
jgi:hypothetical protein